MVIAVAHNTTKGAALVGVLWLLLLLSTVVLSLSRETQLATKITQIYSHEVQARSLVTGAVNESIFWLLGGRPVTELRRKLATDGIEVDLYELEKQTDLNAATRSQLEALLAKHNLPTTTLTAERIIDFRQQAAESRGSENARFKHILELSQVPGISPDVVETLATDITVFGHTPTRRIVTLVVAASYGATRTQAMVAIRLTDGFKTPYQVLSWDWTAS